MSINTNFHSIKNMQHVAIYAKDVTLRRIEQVVVATQKENPTLVELFSEQFFQELLRQYESKKRIYNIYFNNLQKMKEELEAQIEVDNGRINCTQQEYQNLLNAAISDFSVLMATLEIKIEELTLKIKGENHEEIY